MEQWVWIVIIAIIAVAIYFWKQVQTAKNEVAQMIEDGSLLEDSDADLAFALGMGAMRQGNLEEAIQAFSKAESLGHEEAAQELGGLLEKTGQIEEAKLVYRRNVDRTYAPAAINLAMIDEQEGDFESAVRHIREAMAGGVEDSTGSLGEWIEGLEHKAALKRKSGE